MGLINFLTFTTRIASNSVKKFAYHNHPYENYVVDNRAIQTCLWWSSLTLYLSGPTWIWVFFSKSTSIISDSNLWVVDGRLDLSCRRCLPLGKSFTWKKLESGRGKTDSILDVSLADFISTISWEFSCSTLSPSTWQLKMVISGCSKTRKSKPLISSDPTYKNQPTWSNQISHIGSNLIKDIISKMVFVILSEILGKTNLNSNRFWRCTLNSRATQTIPFHYFYCICSVRMESSQTITSRRISHCFLVVAFWLRPGFNWNTFFGLARQQSDHPCSTVERLNYLSILQKSHV